MNAMKMGIWRELREYILIILATMLYSAGVAIFFLPYGLTTGGVAGIASIVYYATGLEIQVTFVSINILLLIVAIKVLGWRFCARTIVAVASLSFGMWLMQRLIEVPDPLHPGKMILPKLVGDQSFMAAILGAIAGGTGLSICFENNGSTGGTDIVAAIVNKYKPISLGSVMRLLDFCIIGSCYFVFHDWSRVIFGFVILFVSSMTLDYMMRRKHQSMQFMIFSRNYRMIANAINDSGHGATILDGTGWYTKSERKVIVAMVHKTDANLILQIVHRVDPFCMVCMTEAEGVFGQSFDVIKQYGNDKPHRTMICATNNEAKLRTARAVMGEGYDIRSLMESGCDTRDPFFNPLLEKEPRAKVSFVKKYFGFDVFYFGEDGVVTLVEGEPDESKQTFTTFNSIEEMKKKLG